MPVVELQSSYNFAMQSKRYHVWAVVVFIILAGVYLRWASLLPMSSLVHYDEAWNWGDAAEIIANPHFTPFFPGNFGREAGWIYLLALFGSVLGASIFTIRFTATITGILTLAAAYRLGSELFNKQVGLWVLAILSVFYWHVHLSQLALRANLFVLLGTLTLGWLLTAYRTNQLGKWLLGGCGLGLMAYTYFASLFWIVLTGIVLLGIFLTDRQRRSGVTFALLLALLLALPLIIYFINNPSLLLNRPTAVATVSSEAVFANLKQWGLAWFVQGDANAAFNLPGRPILDPLTGILMLLGLSTLILLKRYRRRGGLILAYAAAALVPSLLSTYAPHFLRAAGLTVPIAVVLGVGLWGLAKLAQKFWPGKAVYLLPLLAVFYVGSQTYEDFHQKWLVNPETFVFMEQPITQSIKFLQENSQPKAPIYFSPYQSGHPVVRLAEQLLTGHPVAAFVSDQCLVLPTERAYYVSLTMFEPKFEEKLDALASVQQIFADAQQVDDPRFTIFSGQRDEDTAVPLVQFDEKFNVSLFSPLPETIAPNQVIPIELGITPQQKIDMVPSLFVHLYNVTDTAVPSLITQADSQLCASYPAHLWRLDETIVQNFTLTVPPDLPNGRYQIALGIYHFPDGPRLPISAPAAAASPANAFTLYEFELTR